MPSLKTLEQRRAERAWGFVHERVRVLKEAGNLREERVKNAALRLPAMLLTMGLGQTVAFYLSKDKEHQEVLRLLAEHLAQEGFYDSHRGICGETLLQEIKGSTIREYILLSEEALKFATWLKRLAEAELEGGEE